MQVTKTYAFLSEWPKVVGLTQSAFDGEPPEIDFEETTTEVGADVKAEVKLKPTKIIKPPRLTVSISGTPGMLGGGELKFKYGVVQLKGKSGAIQNLPGPYTVSGASLAANQVVPVSVWLAWEGQNTAEVERNEQEHVDDFTLAYAMTYQAVEAAIDSIAKRSYSRTFKPAGLKSPDEFYRDLLATDFKDEQNLIDAYEDDIKKAKPGFDMKNRALLLQECKAHLKAICQIGGSEYALHKKSVMKGQTGGGNVINELKWQALTELFALLDPHLQIPIPASGNLADFIHKAKVHCIAQYIMLYSKTKQRDTGPTATHAGSLVVDHYDSNTKKVTMRRVAGPAGQPPNTIIVW